MLELDVRALPPPQKHPTIYRMLQNLQPGEALRITNDHDPRPLRFELEHDCPNRYRLDYLESGPTTWVVDIVNAGCVTAPNLRVDVPRSGRTMLGGYAWLARLADKVRAQLAGTLGDYVAFCPVSLGFLKRVHVSPNDFSSFVARNGTDEQLVAYLDSRTTGAQRESANHWVLVENADDLRRQDEEEGRARELSARPS